MHEAKCQGSLEIKGINLSLKPRKHFSVRPARSFCWHFLLGAEKQGSWSSCKFSKGLPPQIPRALGSLGPISSILMAFTQKNCNHLRCSWAPSIHTSWLHIFSLLSWETCGNPLFAGYMLFLSWSKAENIFENRCSLQNWMLGRKASCNRCSSICLPFKGSYV